MRIRNLLTTAAMLATVLALGGTSLVANAVETSGPASLVAVPGSDIPKVVLSKDAAGRLGIETVQVKEEMAKHWKLAIGVVEQASGGSGAAAANGTNADDTGMRIKLLLEGEGGVDPREVHLLIRQGKKNVGDSLDDDLTDLFDDIDAKDEGDVNDTTQATDDDPADDTKVTIIPIDTGPVAKRYEARPILVAASLPGGRQYFDPVGSDAGLQPGQRVLVHMVEPNSKLTVKTVPYSSVIYKDDGSSWLFVSTTQFEFRRQEIVIERILGDTVVLSEGPPAGTSIVSIGAAELMGVEQMVGH